MKRPLAHERLDDSLSEDTLRKVLSSEGLTLEQRRQDVVDWVYGQLPVRMGVSRERVEEILKEESLW